MGARLAVALFAAAPWYASGLGLEVLTEGHIQRVALPRSSSSTGGSSTSNEVQVKTLSVDPPIFSVDDILDAADCEALIAAAQRAGIQPMPRHLDLRVDQEFFLRKPVPGSVVDLWHTVDANSDGHADSQELQTFMRQRFHLHSFTLDDARKLLSGTHELGMPYMSKHAFASFDWESFLARRHSEDPSQFACYGSQAFIRPNPDSENKPGRRDINAEPEPLRKLRLRLAKLLSLPDALILPGHEEALQILYYRLGGHRSCHLDSDEESTMVIGRKPVRAVTVKIFLNDPPDEYAGGKLLFPASGLIDGLVPEQHELERRCFDFCNATSYTGNRDTAGGKDHWEHAGLRVTPKRGRIVFWHNHVIISGTKLAAGARMRSSLNADCPVLAGEKWMASFSILLRAPGQEAATQKDSATSTGESTGQMQQDEYQYSPIHADL